MDRFRQDLRFAFASMARRPLIAAAIILTLGLGIGANAAIFRAFSAAFLRPLPFANEERLVRLFLADAARDARLSPRADLFLAVRENARSFEGIAGQRFNDFTAVIGSGEPQRAAGIEVSEGWTRILGISPALGRTFSTSEEAQGMASGAALISDSAWQSRFGGDPGVLGTNFTLNGRPFTVVGVLPAGLRFPYEAEFWVPTRFEQQLDATWGLNIVARLRDGVTHDQMNSELAALSSRLPEITRQPGMTVIGVPIREVLLDDDSGVLVAVSIAVAFLLLLVTVNVANLLVAHSVARRREFAIRTALGASFRRHLQQTMTEGLVLALAGAVVGLFVASASTSLLAFLLPEDFSYVLEELPLDGRVIAFTALIAVLTGCAFGAIPALRVARRHPSSTLIGGDRVTGAPSTMRLTGAMTAAQLALALVLLTGAFGMIRDFERRALRDLGYDAAGVLTLSIVLPPERYAGATERDQFFDALMEKLAPLPGIEAAGTVNLFPAAGQGSIISRIEAEGVETREEAPVMAFSRIVHGQLMVAMKLRLLQGRMLSQEELRRGDRSAVISASLAQRLWPNENPIGRKIRAARVETAPWLEVVGVISDLQEFYGDHGRAIWHPVKLSTDQNIAAQMVIVIRHAAGSILPAVPDAIHEIDPALPVFDVFTAEELYAQSLSGRRSARTLTAAFALVGLVVASIGVYASMAFSMARRTREIAVRIALGGTSRAVTQHFLRRAGSLIAIGLVAGTAAAFALARTYGRLVSDTNPMSFSSLALGIAALGSIALLASWLPLRSATRVEPATILRAE